MHNLEDNFYEDEAEIQRDEVERLAEEKRRAQELTDIKTVLGTKSGMRLMWRLLEHCDTFGSVFSPDSHASASYRAGKQDIGHFLMSEISEADENVLIKLMKINKKPN